ncbi:Ldh family oxidoreductase [Oceanobacillus bengalensis]|uniref:Ldh family oxidoreductase n=1 Tax=Oceanobacillus bengalensis TaxID=1435466 RepID=A0A494YTW6_9BACI|nr:Ldh family oxidoreductase [Oceanobacillus bengalensis]RKQ13555.1 Ldh family oxidoreductase [Oceanobacillus bengalensis]
MSEVKIPKDDLQQYCEAILGKSLPEDEAKIVAETLVDADLRGVTSHGVQRVAGYLKRLEEELIERSTNVQVVNDTYATALLDANNGWGQVAAKKAMELAIEKAEAFGTAFVGVRNSNHFGTASYYTRMAAEKGYIGISMTNASPMMVPFGAKEPSLGTNPISISIPAGEGVDTIVLDMSTSNVARGKIMVAKKNGESIPRNWAITKDGKQTTNPDEAWEGYVLPMGPKGSGLAIIIDILSGVLTGSLFGKRIPRQYDDPYPQRLGHFFGAINIASFGDPDVFYQSIKEKIEETVSSEPSEGFERVLMPGELELMKTKSREENGIPISKEIFNELIETGLKYDVDINQYLSAKLAE